MMYPTYCLQILLVAVIVISGPGYASFPFNGNETDLLALLDFKNQIIQDPLQIMASWNDSVHHCSWTGITCSPLNKRVIIINLVSKKLVGSLPPSISNLTFLTGINLRSNVFQGELPQQIGLLLSLKHLNLTYNSFSGYIPSNLSRCKELTYLALEYNQLVGRIPDSLSLLSNLRYLGLGANNLTGSFPAWIGNFSSSSFFGLSLALNNLLGTIPPEVGRLSGLSYFQIFGNQFFGEIPPSVYNLSSMRFFSVTQNKFHGELPSDIGLRFPNLEFFAGGVNNFSGPIPVSLSNASSLALIDFANNSFTGEIPIGFGNLPELFRINFDFNSLGRGEAGDLDFISSLTNCSNLQVLGMVANFFGGELPGSVANLSKRLEFFSLDGNLINGNIPVGMGNLVNLTTISLQNNFFTGSIPDDIGRLQSLRQLHLAGNRLSGKIPSSIGNLTLLIRIYLQRNRLEGSIPSEIGNLRQLLELDMSDNNLTGIIPKVILSLSSLSVGLIMARNSLTGPLPLEVGKLINLGVLDVSDNKLYGRIPSSLGSCIRLECLIMKGNRLEGQIPESMEALRGLTYIDLSRNNLFGEIPEFFGRLPSLEKLDLSFNNFEGKVPNMVLFSNTSVVSVEGNDRLCGGAPNLHLPSCSNPTKKLTDRNLKLRVTVAISVSVIIFIVLLCSFTVCVAVKKIKRQQHTTMSGSEHYQKNISYHEIYNSTNGFSTDNLIGSGSFGSVYRGVLDHENGSAVAVKVLNLHQKGAAKSFIDESSVLKNVRHRNLLKIVTVCSSVDYQGNDFKCLVFELMSNGSLDEWLHPRNEAQNRTKCLDFVERLNIAIDIASALDYLHNHSSHTPIVHCDLKPSNILLDDDLTARVGDFGLAKSLFEASKSFSSNQNSSVELMGSIGYIPPEYGSSCEASTLGDVYSYGILVLEMFTGKRPTDDLFRDGLCIHNSVATALPHRVMEVVDPSLILAEEQSSIINGRLVHESEEIAIMKSTDFQPNDTTSIVMECLVSLLKIGISCSMPSPKDRMPINAALSKLIAIRELFHKTSKR